MKHALIRFTAQLLVAMTNSLWSMAWAGTPAHVDFVERVQPVLRDRCVHCHGQDGEVSGGVNLQTVKTLADLSPALIDKLIKVIDTGAMPPNDELPLPIMSQRALIEALRPMLTHALQTQPLPTPRTPIRRMNRFQYNNAVQDLLQLKVEVYPLPERLMRDLNGYFQPQTGKMPNSVKVLNRPLGKFAIVERHLSGVTPFPQDLRAEHGFDNRGDQLSLSPLLLESFMQLSRAIIENPDLSAKISGIWEEFFAEPTDSEAIPDLVRKRLRSFLALAFRRPVNEETVGRYHAHVMSELSSGAPFTSAMKSAATAVLASPRFFYLFDLLNDESRPPDDFDLASRLSFFLWGSIPDDELLNLAAKGKLHEADTLRQQVQRLLNDPRLKRFCDSFPAQWLQLERLVSSEPDPQQFPEFYFAKYRASMHMMLEPLLLFETVLVENRSILEFIDADFSYRSEFLEAWPSRQVNGRAGSPTQVVLKRVPITDRRQGGLITNPAVLTMTSSPSRTKPITRGAWLATVIFNSPPPPPPGNVPPLPDRPKPDEAKLTLRERFANHRSQAACAGCHQRIDPLGFALENYDAVGIWRDSYEDGQPIDAAGKLWGRHDFNDIIDFKEALLTEKDGFARALAGHLLAYALGRPIVVSDVPALDQIVTETAAAGYRLQALIEAVVLSDSFRK